MRGRGRNGGEWRGVLRVGAAVVVFATGLLAAGVLPGGAAVGASARAQVGSVHLSASTATVSLDTCARLSFTLYGSATVNNSVYSMSASVDGGSDAVTGQVSVNVQYSMTIDGHAAGGFGSGRGDSGSCGPGTPNGTAFSIAFSTSLNGAYFDDGSGSGRQLGNFSMSLRIDNASSSGNTVPATFTADFTPGAPPPTTTSAPPPPPPPATTTAETTTAAPPTTTIVPTTTTIATTTTVPLPPPKSPTLVLPRRSLTPGRVNPAVRQSTIKTTICVASWTKAIRPPASYVNGLKLKQMKAYGLTGSPAAYDEDHLIPLKLGGAPRDPRNLWPEPRSQSKHSEPLENSLERRVCKGNLTLAAARVQILAFKRAKG